MVKVNSGEDDLFEKIRKIKLLNEILVAWGRDKLIFKDLDEPKKHYTFKVGKNGTLDFHETVEGSKKKYRPKGKVLPENIKKFAYGLRKTLIESFQKDREEINIDDMKYKNSKVFIIPDRESSRRLFLQALKREGKRGLLDKDGMMDLLEEYVSVPVGDLRDHKDFAFGYLLGDEKSPEYFLYQIGGRYFVLKASNFMNLAEKLTEKFMILQKDNHKKAH